MRVGFVGPFGDSNFGDYGMLINNIYDIKAKDITIFSYNIPLISKLAQKYLNNYNLSLCEVNIVAEPNLMVTHNCKEYAIEYNNYPDTPFEILKKIRNYQEILEQISRIDVLVVNGGGYFNHLWNAKHRRTRLLSIIAPILIANQLKKKIVFMGNTYGPFEESTNFFGNFFNYLDDCVIASRDEVYSTSELRKVGYDKPVQHLPDDLYFLNEGFTLPSKPPLTLSGKYIVLELYSSISEIEAKLEQLGQFITTMKRTYDYDVVFLPFDVNYGGEIQGKLLASSFDNITIYDISKPGYLDVSEANSIIKNAEFVICNRYHAFLLAIANNIPVLHFLRDVCGDKRYYFNKSYGLLKSVFRNQMFSETDFLESSLSEAIEHSIKELPAIQEKQKCLFNSEKVHQETILYERRMQYIEDNIWSSEN
ncbi:hypothetical protein MBBA_2450 [Methanoculleus bourgensis]|jgi:polysaccharide pyruvyl transferase WcaK-like protein|uniref:polysaccharide pyruvyl transferase family protein n=1 Tax=Methanoculleus bourgensis TaxID=83986 RepID=UPI0007BCA3BD|nr:polysaccharide pyruvyl transferase family protein [Bacteroidales bacterium]SAI89291.1 hypothetical protein MBBA_2450 [Methanoculleus bourgensis]